MAEYTWIFQAKLIVIGDLNNYASEYICVCAKLCKKVNVIYYWGKLQKGIDKGEIV